MLATYGLHVPQRHTRANPARDDELAPAQRGAPGGMPEAPAARANGTRETRGGARDAFRSQEKKKRQGEKQDERDQKVALENHGRRDAQQEDSERNGEVCAAIGRDPSWKKLGSNWIWKGPMVRLAPARGLAKHCLPRVRSRPPGWFDVVEQWKSFSLTHLGEYQAYGSSPGEYEGSGTQPPMKKWREMPRTQWPPLVGQPVRGWRAWWCAGVIIGWRHRDPQHRYFRKMTWMELHHVRHGHAPFSLRLWTRVLADIAYKEEHEKQFQARRRAERLGKRVWRIGVAVGDGGTVGIGLAPVPLGIPPTKSPGRGKIPPSQWDQRIGLRDTPS